MCLGQSRGIGGRVITRVEVETCRGSNGGESLKMNVGVDVGRGMGVTGERTGSASLLVVSAPESGSSTGCGEGAASAKEGYERSSSTGSIGISRIGIDT
jgi:hypothetical protein